MAPQKSQNNDGPGMKQKSLMGWFTKPPGSSQTPSQAKPQKSAPAPTQKSKAMASNTDESAKKTSSTLKSSTTTPPSKAKASNSGGNEKVIAPSSSFPSTKSSSSASNLNLKDTPPTSDAIDVDMASDDDANAVVSKSKRGKRKMVMEDSDDGLGGKGNSAQPSSDAGKSSPSLGARSKKPRVSLFESDEEDEEEKPSLTKRLSRFKKPALSKKGSRSSDIYHSDSDFAPIEESDEDAPLPSSRPGSSLSGSRSEFESSAAELESASEISDVPKKSYNKKSSKSSRPSLKKDQSNEGGRTGGSSSFLTAAEQRAKEKKTEKKTTEDPFEFLKDVRDKDKNRPGEPGYDPRTLYIPNSAWASFTPFEKQFWEIKQNHYDTVLFFQKGKFLELYEDDARIGHQDFDLKLTDRVKMSMVGVPEMSFNFWAAKFLAKGYKVGRVDQAETALGAEMRLAADKKQKKGAGDKIVRRELNKVYTNGTLVDAELLVDEQAGHCVSIRELDPTTDKGSFGICVLDTSTSEFHMSAFEDDPCRTKLETLIRQLRPKEMLYTKGKLSVATTRLLKAVLPGSCLWTCLREVEGFKYKETLEELKQLYPDDEDDMEGAGIPEAIREMVTCEPAVEALGAMIWYLRQLNIDKDILSMKNFNIYDPMKRGQGLVLDGQTLAHVEVLQNSEGTDEGSLLKILGRCITPFGKRLFRIWLCMPLREASAINARLDAVQDLMDHPTFEGEFAKLVKGIPDLERIVSRIHARNCKVRDFLKILGSFRKLSKGLETLSEIADTFNSKEVLGLLRSAPNLEPNIMNVEDMFIKPDEKSDELLPREGKDATYDGIMEESKELEDELDAALKEFEAKLGCKLSYWHSAVGTKDIYLVQTKAGQKSIPKNWTKQGGTKAASRWHVPELAQSIRTLKEARERRNSAIKNFKFRLYAEFDKDRDVWLRTVRTVAELDCLLSLAKSSSAIGEPACRPEFMDEGEGASLEFEELRHPALDLKSDNFIPNDIKLGDGVGRVALLTDHGATRMLVPAKSARLSPVDSILTRMGAYDNMFSNASTFKVELDECCKILREATPQSLVILDELGRGTSTYDGMAIAGAVLHQLATHTLPLCFFATHYGSLTDDFAYHPNIRNMHMSTIVDDEKCELVFLYKLVEGVASSSFGTHVANLAGVPMDVVKRAEVISSDFARQFKERVEGKRTSTLPLVAQADFAYLLRLATGEMRLPESRMRQREILRCLKEAVPRYVQASS
ncbi:DNA mismatch repair protein Msh6 [Phellopilus nigrolimitatus]|nr:DNA mismatch repair protein Msh6 [Phellopilus nigrolimitatus]